MERNPPLVEATEIRIVSKYGLLIKSFFTVLMKEDNIINIYWRNSPETLGCEITFLKYHTIDTSDQTRLKLQFHDFELLLQFHSEEICLEISEMLSALMVEAVSNKELSLSGIQMQALRNAAYQIDIKQEMLLQLCSSLKAKEGGILVEKVLSKTSTELLKAGFQKWSSFVRDINSQRMNDDKWRWRLHAASNQDLDLQAWYHAIFYQEVYRLRGPFWYRDAVLPVYRNSYDLVDNALTPLEEAALAHVLCSPETSYGDVAGQMFVVQALVKQELFAVFQKLAAQGAQVVKYPRTGRPAKKMFRFSFVEGNIYLTWRGKFGNQGVDLSEVSAVTAGITTDVLRKAATASRADQYLSVICAGRSVDLCFDTAEERNSWRDLLQLLAKKEHGELVGLEPLVASGKCDLFDWLLYFSAIGERVLPLEVRQDILLACDNADTN